MHVPESTFEWLLARPGILSPAFPPSKTAGAVLLTNNSTLCARLLDHIDERSVGLLDPESDRRAVTDHRGKRPTGYEHFLKNAVAAVAFDRTVPEGIPMAVRSSEIDMRRYPTSLGGAPWRHDYPTNL
jgi:hypothetical protein